MDTNIGELLTRWSIMSHCLFVLFRKHGTKFIPGQLYHDFQSSVQDLFFSAAKQLVYYPDKDLFLFLLSDDRLERLFSNVRTLTHDRLVDQVALCSRLTISQRFETIFEKYPHLDRQSRRLQATSDHINTRSWTGSTKVSGLKLRFLWTAGAMRCAKLLSPPVSPQKT
eukprot:Pompholyxophrys_sp_v1_NODE_103_length_1966_cov_40.693792.p1 type:complete len:168 gc:universal NODE_103_length_1966_cov_40.693792:712-209(-)